jgi:hypothetical protein
MSVPYGDTHSCQHKIPFTDVGHEGTSTLQAQIGAQSTFPVNVQAELAAAQLEIGGITAAATVPDPERQMAWDTIGMQKKRVYA